MYLVTSEVHSDILHPNTLMVIYCIRPVYAAANIILAPDYAVNGAQINVARLTSSKTSSTSQLCAVWCRSLETFNLFLKVAQSSGGRHCCLREVPF